jgi:hypothetical protein
MTKENKKETHNHRPIRRGEKKEGNNDEETGIYT